MHPASTFLAFVTPALRRGLLPCLLVVLSLFTLPAHAGTTYAFSGGKVLGCNNKGKVYTCDSIALPQWDDKMVIGNGYTVNVNADVGFGWEQGLSMSGTARLTSSGNIDLAGMNPANLLVSGGSFEAAKTFTVTGPAQVKADVTAGTLNIGTGSTFQITGTMVSRGALSIGSNTTINGSVSGTAIMTNSPFKVTGDVTASDTLLIASGGVIGGTVAGNTSITINSPATLGKSVTSQGPIMIGSGANIGGAVKGTTITADSPVTLNGDVIATTRFTLGSESTVNGNITAPEVELYASSSRIGGNVSASKLLTMGHDVRVKGTVDTGQLTMYASDALIEGVAKVDFATLYWNGRVSQTIVCKAGTRAGYCDCVDNQSGNPVNTANGPRCESGKPVQGPLHHFQITHDGSGQTCAPESVTVTACANAACSAPHYTSGARVTLQPGGDTVIIGSSGVASGNVSRNTAGVETLKLVYTGAVTSGATCRNSATGSASCDMAFSGGVAFSIDVPDHRAAENAGATIKALQSDPKTNQCVAAFKSTDKPIQYSCGYVTSSKDTAGLTLADAALNASTNLVCSSGAKKAVTTRFDANGAARLTLNYGDVGKLKLMAELDDARGDATFIVAPHRFGFGDPPKPAANDALRAGDDFKITVNALNAKGAVTPSFDQASLPLDATKTTFAVECAAKGSAGALGTTAAAQFSKGSASPTLWWSEVGAFDLKATLTDFLGSGLDVSGTSDDPKAGCTASVGPFIPKYFLVDQTKEEADKKRPFYYAGEPVPVRVSAMNARHAVTQNYDGVLGYSSAVTLAAYDSRRETTNPNGGRLAPAQVKADGFSGGAALVNIAYASATATPIAPTQIVLRATTGAAPTVTSNDAKGDYEKARPQILSGRLRVANAFGRVGATVGLEIVTDYWSGRSWLFNAQDNVTRIPANAFAQTASSKAGSGLAPTITKLTQAVAIKDGKAEPTVKLTGNRAGWIDLAINLGAGANTPDLACLGSHPPVTGAELPWLRQARGCRDPAGRATFGELAPENRRIIHVREVFN